MLTTISTRPLEAAGVAIMEVSGEEAEVPEEETSGDAAKTEVAVPNKAMGPQSAAPAGDINSRINCCNAGK